MNEKLWKVIFAIGDCEGTKIPYPITKKMMEIKQELK